MAAGAKKRYAGNEAKPKHESSNGSSSGEASRDPTQRAIKAFDGNRDPSIPDGRRPIDYMTTGSLKNLSEFLGAAGWYAARGLQLPKSLPQRPKNFNTLGKECPISLNTFNVTKLPTAKVEQYDLSFTGDAKDYTKRALLKKIWASPKLKAEIGEPAAHWIWDGNKLAWSSKKLNRAHFRVEVDLDAEEGRTPRPNARGNKHAIHLNHTKTVDFYMLGEFLGGKVTWDNTCIDTVNFIDHLMREFPSQQYTQIKKSFFQRGEQRFDLGGGVEAFKGVFASLRPVLDDRNQRNFSVNVDVANGTFWRAQDLTKALLQAFGNITGPQFAAMFQTAQKNWKNSQMKRDLRRFKKVGVSTLHTTPSTQWTIDEFVNMDAHQAKFPDPGNKDTSKEVLISVAEYFKRKYKKTVLSNVPVVKMTKKIRKGPVYMPIEFLKIDENQRYNSKLSDQQTSQMIRFAVTLPSDRWNAVMGGVRLLNWGADPYLQHYGLQINSIAAKVKARILPSPTVHFGAGSKEPTIKPVDMIQGRWRLDGRKFAMCNQARPLKAWGMCIIQGRGSVPPQAAEAFISKFVQIYEGHGGFIMSHPQFGKKPWIGPGSLGDGGELVAKVWNQTGNKYGTTPNFLFFVVNDRNVDTYRRIKKSCDIRFGVASQVMQAKHVMSASPQYISNVCMKVNAKLGGATSVAKSNVVPKVNPKAASTTTMVVGADVSHPAPGAGSTETASFAAITVSADALFAKYWAEVQTNGNRVEMVTTSNIDMHFGSMIKMWMERLGQGKPPERLLYIRDGVSEGQYAAVLEEEVRDMKEAFMKAGCKTIPKFTVVIAGKRHHIRFFPDKGKGDRNNNPLPGTLVETGCTHPFEFDFYLCSHVAIKGTARPIHYQCILNEGNWVSTELQQFIFEHCYQYVRSTTPVSLHPAVYYAHLAADRARAHLNESPVSSGKKESKAEQKSSTGSSSKRQGEVQPLMRMQNSRGLKEVMWYI